MARCRCAETLCSCVLTPGEGVTLTGDGTRDNPWRVSVPFPSLITAGDSDDIDVTITGTGTAADPLVISASMRCIDCAAPANVGDVLTRQPGGMWSAGPPTQVPPGAIITGLGITGQGNVAQPLRVDLCTYADLRTACVP